MLDGAVAAGAFHTWVGQNTLTKNLLSTQQKYNFPSTDEAPIDFASGQDPK